MATLDWQTTAEDGVVLVHLLVRSDVRQRVRIANCLEGPVWPPRRQGVPAAGWDADGFEGVVGPDERLVLGYACPAAETTPPAEIASADPAGETAADGATPRDVIRALGDPRPPRDAVPVPDDDHSTEELPESVAAWLADVSERVEEAQRLGRASSVPEATAAVDAVGGLEAVRTLDATLSADEERLERVAERSRALADSIEGVDVPVETLDRLV